MVGDLRERLASSKDLFWSNDIDTPIILAIMDVMVEVYKTFRQEFRLEIVSNRVALLKNN